MLLLGGCGEATRLTSPAEQKQQASDHGLFASEPKSTASFPNNDRSHVALSVQGDLVPLARIEIVGVAHGRRTSSQTNLRIRAGLPPRGGKADFAEKIVTSRVAAGESVTSFETVSFAEPGYYHVLATASTASEDDNAADKASGVPTPSVVAKNLWVLIEEGGGRVDTAYDHSILRDTSRYLTQGSVGAFRPRSPKASSGYKVLRTQEPSKGTSSAIRVASSTSSRVFSGRITFIQNDGFGNNATQGVSDLRVVGFCSTIDGQSLGGYDLKTDQAGVFAVTCPSESFSLKVIADLSAPGVVVTDHNNVFAGVDSWIGPLISDYKQTLL